MKKIYLVLAVLALGFTACNKQAPATEEVTEETTETVVEEPVVEETTSSTELPAFESEELTAFATEFDAYFDKSMELLKAGDMEGLAALEEEGKALQEKGELLKDAVSEADQALFEDYLKGKAEEMLKASGLDQMMEKAAEEMGNNE